MFPTGFPSGIAGKRNLSSTLQGSIIFVLFCMCFVSSINLLVTVLCKCVCVCVCVCVFVYLCVSMVVPVCIVRCLLPTAPVGYVNSAWVDQVARGMKRWQFD